MEGIENNIVSIKDSQDISKGLNEFLIALMARYKGVTSIESKLVEIEKEINDSDLPESLTDKIKLYETLSKIHISYAESIRRVLVHCDSTELVRTLGLVELVSKFRSLPQSSLKKIQSFLDLSETKEIDESLG